MIRLKCLLCLLLACLSPLAQALPERLRLVTDDWAPYAHQQRGQAAGLDYAVASEVLKRLGVDVELEFMPWKRCMAMAEQGQIDGILDIFHTAPRERFLVFPDEPLSTADLVLFQARKRPHSIDQPSSLAGLTVGTSPGYTYGDVLAQWPGLRREDAPTHEANFGKLALGRIDLLLIDRRVGRYVSQQLGLGDSVEELPLVLGRQQQFLAFTRTPEHEALAVAFAEELRRFKQEPAFAALNARYENGTDDILDAVEQHDGSTAR